MGIVARNLRLKKTVRRATRRSRRIEKFVGDKACPQQLSGSSNTFRRVSPFRKKSDSTRLVGTHLRHIHP